MCNYYSNSWKLLTLFIYKNATNQIYLTCLLLLKLEPTNKKSFKKCKSYVYHVFSLAQVYCQVRVNSVYDYLLIVLKILV